MLKLKFTKKFQECFLACVFVLFIICDCKPPFSLAEFFRSFIGKGVILISVAYLFVKTNPILGILSVFVAYKLINVSNFISFLPSQMKMDRAINSYQPVHDNLEEEIISNVKNHTVSFSTSPYLPVLSDVHDARSLH